MTASACPGRDVAAGDTRGGVGAEAPWPGLRRLLPLDRPAGEPGGEVAVRRSGRELRGRGRSSAPGGPDTAGRPAAAGAVRARAAMRARLRRADGDLGGGTLECGADDRCARQRRKARWSASTWAARSPTPPWWPGAGSSRRRSHHPRRPERGRRRGGAGRPRRAGLSPSDVVRFGHGMTVGTNALLRGKGARTSLVATEGFGDLLELRRRDPGLALPPRRPPPSPLIPHDRSHEVAERCGPEVLRPLDPGSLARAVEAVRPTAPRPSPWACCSPRALRPRAGGGRGAARGPARRPRERLERGAARDQEYERLSTTAVDAYPTPVLQATSSAWGSAPAQPACPRRRSCSRAAGCCRSSRLAEHAAWTVLSGPAGGVIGAARPAASARRGAGPDVRHGGHRATSRSYGTGPPARTSETVIAGHPLHLPMLDVATVSAGGGSIAWADSGGALRVGPGSAGARPGPAAYGLGGTLPTVTDANVVLGRLPADAPRRRDHARASGRTGGGRAPRAARDGAEARAEGILAVAVQEMVRALRSSVERGGGPARGRADRLRRRRAPARLRGRRRAR